MAGLSLLYCGCSVGPNYVKPPVETPTAYKENAGWKVAQPQDELPGESGGKSLMIVG